MTDQRRSIHANEKNKDEITHHVSINGTVHNGDPRNCIDFHCRQWGERQHILIQAPPDRRHPVYMVAGIFLTILMALLAIGIVVLIVENIHKRTEKNNAIAPR